MKVTLSINNTHRGETNKVVLFGARYHYLAVNFGNNASIQLKDIEFDDDYKKAIGYSNGEDGYNDGWYNHYAFLMDCIKYDLRVISVNGIKLKRKIIGSVPPDYEIIEELNPYLEKYEFEVPSGEHKIVIELKRLY